MYKRNLIAGWIGAQAVLSSYSAAMGMSLSTLERQGATMSSTMAPHIAYNCMDDVTNNMCHTAHGG